MSGYEDLRRRLRDGATCKHDDLSAMDEAADAIERLSVELADSEADRARLVQYIDRLERFQETATAHIRKLRANLDTSELRAKVATDALSDIADGHEHVQCLLARPGEMTQECPINTPCEACRAARVVEKLRGKFAEANSRNRKILCAYCGHVMERDSDPEKCRITLLRHALDCKERPEVNMADAIMDAERKYNKAIRVIAKLVLVRGWMRDQASLYETSRRELVVRAVVAEREAERLRGIARNLANGMATWADGVEVDRDAFRALLESIDGKPTDTVESKP